MNKYTIHCTEEQTKKAFELGAPIVILPNYEEYKGFPFVRHTNGNEYPCAIPTAEQMLGWLEERGLYIQIDNMASTVGVDFKTIYDRIKTSRKEATLAAIDVALDYLIRINR